MLQEVSVGVPVTVEGDVRVGQVLGQALEDGRPPKVVIVGFPTDVGVVRNGGRPGAAAGPLALRQRLWKMTPDPEAHEEMVELLAHTLDLGDLRCTEDLARDQAALGEILAPYLASDIPVIVLGGGHETAWGHLQGYLHAGKAATLRNLDAHSDVRPLREGLGHSGSPFRQALSHPSGLFTGYRVQGLARTSVSVSHLAFLREHGARYTFADALTLSELTEGWEEGPHMVATFCLDAVDQGQAPGVSAPATGGIPARWWLAAARAAGASPTVSSFDIVELSPPFDRDGQTERLAAATVWWFLRGLLDRA